jgi:hypothetical protein
VAAAGEIAAKNSRITEINNRSGHYGPTTAHTDQVIQQLKKQGVDVSNVERDEYTDTRPNTRFYRGEDGTLEPRQKNY